MLSHEQYPERSLASGCHLLKKNLINIHGGLLDVTTYTSNRVHIIKISSAAPSFMGDPKNSEHTLLCYLKHNKVGWSTENYPHTGHLSLTCTLSRWRYAVFLYEVSIDRPKENEKWKVFDISAEFCAFQVKTTKKKRTKPWLNARKHWESESRNRKLSAAVLHVKASRHISNSYNSRENDHQVEILNLSSSLHYCKRNKDFITINFQKFSFFRESFTCSNVLLDLSLEIYFPWQ